MYIMGVPNTSFPLESLGDFKNFPRKFLKFPKIWNLWSIFNAKFKCYLLNHPFPAFNTKKVNLATQNNGKSLYYWHLAKTACLVIALTLNILPLVEGHTELVEIWIFSNGYPPPPGVIKGTKKKSPLGQTLGSTNLMKSPCLWGTLLEKYYINWPEYIRFRSLGR